VFEVPQFTARLQNRKQLTHNLIRLVDRAQHQGAHRRVEWLGVGKLLHRFGADGDGYRRGGSGLSSQYRQPVLGLNGDHLGHGVWIQLEVRAGARTDLEHPSR
jgi:hypothetical protein